MSENKPKQDKMVVEYQTQYGDNLKLSMGMVRNFLVSGKKELVSDQELVFFMHTCKARKLNPFLKDCYLVKYSNDPAAIITGVDYFRKNARKANDCAGWSAGVIVQKKDDEIEYREGSLVFPTEILMGGWAEAQPKDWPKPKKWTVNLQTYIKKTKDGSVTKFWKPDKQPGMISKVAEVQLLRQIWGEESTGMYAPEEMPSLEDVTPSDIASVTLEDMTSDPRDAVKAKLDEMEGQTERKSEKHSCPIPECDFEAKSERGLKKHMTQSHPIVDAEFKEEPKETKKNGEDMIEAAFKARKAKFEEDMCTIVGLLDIDEFQKELTEKYHVTDFLQLPEEEWSGAVNYFGRMVDSQVE